MHGTVKVWIAKSEMLDCDVGREECKNRRVRCAAQCAAAGDGELTCECAHEAGCVEAKQGGQKVRAEAAS